MKCYIFESIKLIILSARALFGLVVLWSIWLSHSVYPQNAIQVEKLTTDGGLNFRHVNSIAQDHKGFMWFGTSQGLSKYDGNGFKVFNNSKNNPNFIPYEDVLNLKYQKSTNILWFIANLKLFALNLNTEKLEHITGLDDALKGDVLDMVFDKTDNLWVVVDYPVDNTKTQHLIKYDGKSFQNIKSLGRKSAGFTSIKVTENNEILWTTVNHGLTSLNQEGEILKQNILESYDWYGYTIHFGRSFIDSNNQHYYSPESQGGVNVYKNLEFSHRLIDNNVVIYNAVEYQNGGIWFCGKKELFYLNPSGEFFDYTSEVEAVLDFSSITSAYLDFSNLLWLGTDNGLLKVKLQAQNFETILHNNQQGWGLSFRDIFGLKNGDIAAMCETENQLYRINPAGEAKKMPIRGAFEKLKDARFFVSDTINNKAFTVTNYLIEIDLSTNELNLHEAFSPYLNETKPNPVIKLEDGSLLMGYSLSQLIKVDPKTKAFAPVFKTKPENDYILKTFIQSKINPNVIWVGTQSRGLLKLNLSGKIEAQYNINTTPSLSKNSVLSLLEFNDQLFVGTFGGGINVLDLKQNSIQVINAQKGLCDDSVVSILPVNANEIIAGTYHGLARIHLKTLDIQNNFEKEGISDNEFNYTSSYKSKDGQFYFGGLNGITEFSAENLIQKRELPALNFTQLEVFNQQKDTIIQRTKLDENPVVLSPYDINLKVDWSIPDYFNQNQYTYYTKMEGFEDKWFNQGQSHSIRYNQLPAGEYQLKVKAEDINGNESKAGLSIPIIVNPIFYKTWWFIGLVILFIVGIIYIVFQYRLQQALAVERLRTKISSDLHDDVGSMLTGLAMQTEMLEMQATNEKDRSKLHKITDTSRKTISHMRDLVWSIDSRKDTLGNLLERMHELAEEQLQPAGFSYHINVDDINLQKKINFNCRRNLYLIYKEAINNVIKHSNAKHVFIEFNNNKGTCQFNIKDDGHLKVKKHMTGQGLANMKMRAQNINADLKFDVENGFGIFISIPNVA